MSEPDHRPAEVVASPAKAVRLAGAIDALVAEVHAAPLDEAARVRLLRAYHAALVEVGSTVSDALLEELRRLGLTDLDPQSSLALARVAVSQLDGWLHGVLEGMFTGALSFDLALPQQPGD